MGIAGQVGHDEAGVGATVVVLGFDDHASGPVPGRRRVADDLEQPHLLIGLLVVPLGRDGPRQGQAFEHGVARQAQDVPDPASVAPMHQPVVIV